MQEPCTKCHKPMKLCLCAEISPLNNKVRVLILQHPQEPDKKLGTAPLIQSTLANSAIRIGLSWRNLTAAAGDTKPLDHSKWGVLYLGTGLKNAAPGLYVQPKKSEPVAWNSGEKLKGLVVLDGTWSQAKTLWWRNAWLLKLKRLVLAPTGKSLYGPLRKEPRRECLSTLESVGAALTALGEDPVIEQALRDHFSELLKRASQRGPQSPANAPVSEAQTENRNK